MVSLFVRASRNLPELSATIRLARIYFQPIGVGEGFHNIGGLGRVLIHLARNFKIPLINIVRRPEQVTMLKNYGAEFVLNSQEDGFVTQLDKLARRLKATVAFDAVGGELTPQLIKAMPENSTIYVYGSLSPEPLDYLNMSARNQTVKTFSIYRWAESKSVLAKIFLIRRLQNIFRDGFRMDIRKRISLKEAPRPWENTEAILLMGKF